MITTVRDTLIALDRWLEARLRPAAGRARRPGLFAQWNALDDDPPLLCACCCEGVPG